MSQRYFASISPGLEALLLDELRHMKVRKCVSVRGGVEFEATARGFYEVMAWSRLANRVMLRLDVFRARDAMELYRKAGRIAWERVLPPGAEVVISSSAHQSRLKGSGEIADRVRDAILSTWREEWGTPPSFVPYDPALVGGKRQRLFVRLEDNQCTVSIDASGAPMFRRGWRHQTGAAPLRENMAAAMLQAISWAPGTPLLDPTCGSGTFLIEAAKRQRQQPPRIWEDTDYAFHHWPNYQPARWDAVTSKDEAEVPDTAHLWGQDVDSGVLAVAAENARRAGVLGDVIWDEGAVSEMKPQAAAGVLVSNPPYGERLSRYTGDHQKGPVEQSLFASFLAHFAGWRMGVLLPATYQPRKQGLVFTQLLSFSNGGLDVCFWEVTHA